MSLPFENDTSKFLKNYASKSLKENRGRNIPVLITIVVAVAFMTSFLFFPLSTVQKSKNLREGSYQAGTFEVSDKEISSLRNSFGQDNVGLVSSFPSKETKDYKMYISCQDEVMMRLAKNNIKGKIPKESNEILVRQDLLDHYKIRVGDSVSLDLGLGDKSYEIVGTLSNEGFEIEDTKNFMVVVSEKFVEDCEKNKGVDVKFNAYYRLPSVKGLSIEEQKSELYALSEKAGITKEDTILSRSYFDAYRTVSNSTIISIAAIAISILLAAGVVIYSVFYISIKNSIREFGRLRILGATRKQIINVVLRQGRFLSFIGGIIGILIGSIASYLITPDGWNWITFIFGFLILIVVTSIMVMLSIYKPAKIAAETSPVEAIKFNVDYSNINRSDSKKIEKLNPKSVAKLNFNRNRKKIVLTMISLCLSGVILVSAGTFVESMSSEKAIRTGKLSFGEFFIYLNTDNIYSTDDFKFSKLQENNPIDESFIKTINSIDGVKGITIDNILEIDCSIPTGKKIKSQVSGFNRAEKKRLKNYIKKGDIDYNKLKEDGIIITIASTIKEVYGWNPSVGDKVELEYRTKGELKRRTLEIQGTIDERVKEGEFILPDEVLKEMSSENLMSRVIIETDLNKTDSVDKDLRKIVSETENIGMDTLDEVIKSTDAIYRQSRLLVYSLCVAIILFGLISLINLIITNVFSQKYEFATMQAVGMTERQIKKMVYYESMIYSITTIISTLTLGTLSGYVVYKVANNILEPPILEYKFPILMVLVFLVSVVLVQFITSAYILKIYTSTPLSERIKNID